MLSVNENALEIAEDLIDWSDELNVEAIELKNGCTVIDCGVNVSGSYEAGRMFTDICMGGLSSTSVRMGEVGGVPLAFIEVSTDFPAIACLGAQKAGWKIMVDDYFAMGSGPARALALKPRKTYEQIEYEDDYEGAVIALESDRLPDERVVQFIADECQVETENLVVLVAPTSSLVGSVQVSGRVVETAIYRLNELGFDTTRIESGIGTAPIAPVVKDNTRAMGVTNDSIIYHGSVYLTLRGIETETLKQVPSSNSRDYGKPFYESFKEAGFDFFKIDTSLFAPAEITVNDLETGETYHAGNVNEKVLLESYQIVRL